MSWENRTSGRSNLPLGAAHETIERRLEVRIRPMASEPETSTLADRDGVHDATRLGWAVAELRGRVRNTAARPATERARPTGILPLAQERSPKEQLIEYFNLIGALARRLNVDTISNQLTGAPKGAPPTASEWLRRVAWSAATVSGDDREAAAEAQRELNHVLYVWDARIQDDLASRPTQSAAYQLARGMAEIRWGYDAQTGEYDDLAAATFLLGPDRGERLDRLLDRLSEHYDPVTLHAIASSLQAWRIHDPGTSSPPDEAWRTALAAQATIWHDLVLGHRTGESLVSPRDMLEHPGTLWPIIRGLLPESLVVLIGAVLLIAGAWFLLTQGVDEIPVVSAILGLFGLTAGSVAVKAKTSAHDLIGSLRNDLYRGLVADKALVPPPPLVRK
jgi:hypothetical protein